MTVRDVSPPLTFGSLLAELDIGKRPKVVALTSSISRLDLRNAPTNYFCAGASRLNRSTAIKSY